MTPAMPYSPGPIGAVTSPYDVGRDSPFNPASKTPFPSQPSRFGAPGAAAGAIGTSSGSAAVQGASSIERQTCIL
jgi:hypothetical protein